MQPVPASQSLRHNLSLKKVPLSCKKLRESCVLGVGGMRQRRIKARSDSPVGHYHCVSRVVDRTYRFGEQEKEFFRKLFRLYEDFCGIRVLSYCVMSNHFHLLLEVPRRPDVLPDDSFLLEKLGKIYSRGTVSSIRREIQLRSHNPELLAAYREQFFRRMWDLSNFMKLVKQRFSIWFNRVHRRRGTLWEERFHSVLIEAQGQALGAIAAYIDLNPVRAGIVTDPKDYRWCSYAESVAGNHRRTLWWRHFLPTIGISRSIAN
jgi:REP element-mobilizing transposase RayT